MIGKSRIALMEYTSMPRLELATVVLSVKMNGIIKKEMAIDQSTFGRTVKLLY